MIWFCVFYALKSWLSIEKSKTSNKGFAGSDFSGIHKGRHFCRSAENGCSIQTQDAILILLSKGKNHNSFIQNLHQALAQTAQQIHQYYFELYPKVALF